MPPKYNIYTNSRSSPFLLEVLLLLAVIDTAFHWCSVRPVTWGCNWRPSTILKRDSDIVAFQWILQNFIKHLLWRKHAKGCFCNSKNTAILKFPHWKQYLWRTISKCDDIYLSWRQFHWLIQINTMNLIFRQKFALYNISKGAVVVITILWSRFRL